MNNSETTPARRGQRTPRPANPANPARPANTPVWEVVHAWVEGRPAEWEMLKTDGTRLFSHGGLLAERMDEKTVAIFYAFRSIRCLHHQSRAAGAGISHGMHVLMVPCENVPQAWEWHRENARQLRIEGARRGGDHPAQAETIISRAAEALTIYAQLRHAKGQA